MKLISLFQPFKPFVLTESAVMSMGNADKRSVYPCISLPDFHALKKQINVDNSVLSPSIF